MGVTEAFSEGWDTYKENFWELQVLNAARLAAVLGLVLLGVILMLPAALSGAGSLLSSPETMAVVPAALRLGTYLAGWGLLLAVVAVLALPLLSFPHLAGAVLARTDKLRVEDAFGLLRDNYFKLLLDSLLYSAAVGFLFLEAVLFMLSAPLLGLLAFGLAVYVAVRLVFWDVLLLGGEEHPLRASWRLTAGRFWTSALFIFASNLVCGLTMLVPMLGPVLSFLCRPFTAAAKASFAASAGK